MSNFTSKVISTVFLIAFLASCAANKELVSVLVEKSNGDVELFYSGIQSPDNLVKEIRYYANSDTMTITPMVKGLIEGGVKFYYQGNVLKEETQFLKGVQDGVFKRYDENGLLVFEGYMREGIKEGIWTTWYDEVQMEEQKTYAGDQLHGKWTFWYADGNIRREEVYEHGKLIEDKDYN